MLNPLRGAARVLTGSSYVALGYAAVREPAPRAEQAAALLSQLRNVLPLPTDDQLLVRANGASQMLAGAAIASGRSQRAAAAVLFASLAPTTLAGHAFWTHEDPAARRMQRVQFLKNLAMLGGLLFAVVD